MTTTPSKFIKFSVETSRVLKILSSEIYDSPYALLRENLQNAYDAVLMRCKLQDIPLSDGQIEITLDEKLLTISDNGIGMDETVLRSCFWTAGSSGKTGKLAKESGVIGTFGIGAMANFGVCSKLTVTTRPVIGDETFISVAERDSLSIAEDCITLESIQDERPPGTKICATISDEFSLTEEKCIEYLSQYIKFLPVAVYMNGQLLSQGDFLNLFNSDYGGGFEEIGDCRVEDERYFGHLSLLVNGVGTVAVRLDSLTIGGRSIEGNCIFVQRGGQLMCYRSSFGLAPAPISGHFQFGGGADLSILHPTAGREALSRESVHHVHQLVALTERYVSEILSRTNYADRNIGFLDFVASTKRPELAEGVTVEVHPGPESIALGHLRGLLDQSKLIYYAGRNLEIVRTFASEHTRLAHISQNNPRRKVQLMYIQTVLGLEKAPDEATVVNEYDTQQLTREEASLLVRMGQVLADDYLLSDFDVRFAEITHNVILLTKKQDGELVIWINREGHALQALYETYRSTYELFPAFVNDFVRTYVYPRIAQYVPSATREGAEALYKALQRNRELFRLEQEDLGDLGSYISDLLKGETGLGEAIIAARKVVRSQTQSVRQNDIGRVEEELQLMHEQTASQQSDNNEQTFNEYDAAPPIMRLDVTSRMKMLMTDGEYPSLNNFRMFLALSDRLFKREGEFFHWPHTTRIIWGGHRIVYIFMHASQGLTLYYDIELKELLSMDRTGGAILPSTTIVTGKKIYIPIPRQLEPEFEIADEAKEFFVRYDTILS
jgi:molecular chaperone HtpG